MTLSEMIDITRMETLYMHRLSNPEIKDIIQVFGDEEYLAKVGQWMIEDTNDNLASFKTAYKIGKVRIIDEMTVLPTNAVKCLYIPPFYLFIDLNKPYL